MSAHLLEITMHSAAMMYLFVVLFAIVVSAQAFIMPMENPDGSINMKSLLSHLTLLEQKIDNKASMSVTTKLNTALHDLTVTQTKLDTALEELKGLPNLKTELAVLQSQIQSGNSPCTCGSSVNAGSQPTQDLSALRADVFTLRADVNKILAVTNQTNVSHLSSDVSTLKSELNQIQSLTNKADIPGLVSDVSTIKTQIFQLQSLHNTSNKQQSSVLGSSVYTRWGKTSCPGGNSVVYKGYAAGSHYTDKGGSPSMLCLPEHPIYSNHTYGSHEDYASHIWGTEFDQIYPDMPFNTLLYEDMPCVVCESKKHTSIMVPARTDCYQGWTAEYSGILMGGYKDHSPVDHICVDSDAEAVPGGHDAKSGRFLYPVESKCGPLVCPPYVEDKIVTCVICSK